MELVSDDNLNKLFVIVVVVVVVVVRGALSCIDTVKASLAWADLN